MLSLWHTAEVIRVLLVDDHEMMLEGMDLALSAQDDIEVVGRADTVDEGLARYRSLAPDVVVTDYRIGDRTGSELARSILAFEPAAVIVAVSALDNAHTLNDIVSSGCAGFVAKGNPIEDLVAAIRATNRGSISFPRQRLQASRSERNAVAGLTRRELEVLQALAEGQNVTQIADDLHLSAHTVRNHVREILRKLDVSSQLAAVVEGARQGIIAGPGPAA